MRHEVTTLLPPSPFRPAGRHAFAGIVRPAAWIARLIGPDRRLLGRTALEGTVTIDGRPARLVDLCWAGFRIDGYRGPLAVQDRFAFVARMTVGNTTVSGEAVVAWRAGGRLGAAFYALAEEGRAGLDGILGPNPGAQRKLA